jgi:hypothetical protein
VGGVRSILLLTSNHLDLVDCLGIFPTELKKCRSNTDRKEEVERFSLASIPLFGCGSAIHKLWIGPHKGSIK